MERVTIADLEAVCRRINRTVNGTDETPVWTMDDTCRKSPVANIGVFYLDGAYGGYALYRIMSEGGGVTDVLGTGHTTKRGLQARMFSFLEGIDYGAKVRT